MNDQRIGNYRIVRQLGVGGMRAVYEGRHDQIASAVAAAHEQRIVHRDLKPENIMVVADPEAPGRERTKVLDFGIAKLATDLKAPGEQATHTRMMMGTPAYMAPEQCRGLTDLNDRADVFVLGIILYEMISGATLFRGDMGELIAAHLYKTPAPLAGPAELDGLVQRMLVKKCGELGERYYQSGQYALSIQAFRQAYVLKPLPIFLYDMAQAHRLAGQTDEAIQLYERYLREDPGAQQKAESTPTRPTSPEAGTGSPGRRGPPPGHRPRHPPRRNHPAAHQHAMRHW